MGTCHKGLLGNLGSKTGAFGKPWDELRPYRLGGRAWAWGCGSNDGRCGVERFLNMKGEGRPPEVDLMKCYMMGPHRIGLARPAYWKHPSLRDLRVLMLASGRNHMAAIA